MNGQSLVFWSGGLDSTLALYDAAKTPGWKTTIYGDGTSAHAVRAVSVECEGLAANPEQVAARARIRAKFDELKIQVEYTSITLSRYDFFAMAPGARGSRQTPLWLGLASSLLKGEEDLVIGFCDDDANDNVGDVRTAFDAMQKVAGRTGKLVLPFVDKMQTKAHVLERARTLGFADLCVWCQVPKDGKPCKGTRCLPCVRYAAAAWTIEQPFWPKFRKAMDADE